MLIIMMFLLVFGILGVQLWKGGIGECNDPSDEILTRQDCENGSWFLQEVTNHVGIVVGYERVQRKWYIPENNYNNVFSSVLTFFEISTLEMWPGMMFNAIDIVGPDMKMKQDNNLYVAFIFVVYIFFTTFFIMNLFISVIVDKFNEEIKKRQGSHNFTEEQKEWVKI